MPTAPWWRPALGPGPAARRHGGKATRRDLCRARACDLKPAPPAVAPARRPPGKAAADRAGVPPGGDAPWPPAAPRQRRRNPPAGMPTEHRPGARGNPPTPAPAEARPGHAAAYPPTRGGPGAGGAGRPKGPIGKPPIATAKDSALGAPPASAAVSPSPKPSADRAVRHPRPPPPRRPERRGGPPAAAGLVPPPAPGPRRQLP